MGLEDIPVETLRLAGNEFRIAPVFVCDFDGDARDWPSEGGAEVVVRQGRLHIDAVDRKPPVATVWCPQAFEGDQVIEYVARTEKGPGTTNMNFILCAANPDGTSVLDSRRQRTGAYDEYHQMPNYIITYLNDDGTGKQEVHPDHEPFKTRVRFRRDPGFELLHECWREAPVEKGRDYHFAIVLDGPRVRLFVDGEQVFDTTDARPAHRRGHHAFRTWAAHLSIDWFRVSRLVR